MKRVAVAALSVRALAEAAARDGMCVMALDCFGDQDTLRAASHWVRIGTAQPPRIDDALLLDALEDIARRDQAQGWIAGSGFEGRPDLLHAGAKRLPLVGNGAKAVRAVRDPRRFFRGLDERGIAHPPVRHEPLLAPEPGWLVKDFGACGGWHVQRSDGTQALADLQYLQRERHEGVPMSATFVADAREVHLLGVNRQLVQPRPSAPFAFAGVIGPLPVSAAVSRQVADALHAVTQAFALRGLCSLDFLLRPDEVVEVLEVNPRPPASLALHGAGLIAAHVQACERGACGLPRGPARSPVQGTSVVYAEQALYLNARGADWLASQADVGDLPQPGNAFDVGDPVCSVRASGGDDPAVSGQLAQRRDALLRKLEAFA